MFNSSIFGEVAHPVNILSELISLFNRRQKVKAAILSWLDSWLVSGHDEWVWIVAEDLAKTLGYVSATIRRHLNQLVAWGILERKKAKRWPTDKAFAYRVNIPKLAPYLVGAIAKAIFNPAIAGMAKTLMASCLDKNVCFDAHILLDRYVKNDVSIQQNVHSILNQSLTPDLIPLLKNPPLTPPLGEEGGENLAQDKEEEMPLSKSPQEVPRAKREEDKDPKAVQTSSGLGQISPPRRREVAGGREIKNNVAKWVENGLGTREEFTDFRDKLTEETRANKTIKVPDWKVKEVIRETLSNAGSDYYSRWRQGLSLYECEEWEYSPGTPYPFLVAMIAETEFHRQAGRGDKNLAIASACEILSDRRKAAALWQSMGRSLIGMKAEFERMRSAGVSQAGLPTPVWMNADHWAGQIPSEEIHAAAKAVGELVGISGSSRLTAGEEGVPQIDVGSQQSVAAVAESAAVVTPPDTDTDTDTAKPALARLREMFKTPLGKGFVLRWLAANPDWGYEICDGEIREIPF